MEFTFPVAGVTVAWPLLVLIGLAVGTLMGFFGVGGGWLTAPALNVLGFPIAHAIGTSLTYTFASSALGTFYHFRLGNLEPRVVAAVGLSGMAGVEAARRAVLGLEASGQAETLVRLLYVALLWSIGLATVLEVVRGQAAGGRPGEEAEPRTRLSEWVHALRLPPMVRLEKAGLTLSVWVLVLIGLVVGAASGFLGAGGGFIAVPLLVYVAGVPTRVAVASSLFSIVLTTGFGGLSYGLAGRVEPFAVALMFVGALLGSRFGALATTRVKSSSLRGLLGLALLLAGLAVLLAQLHQELASEVVMLGTACALTTTIFVISLRRPGLVAD